MALGSTVQDYELFLFAGGHIRAVRDEPYSQAEDLAISLGGIGVQLAAGGVALLLARRRRAASIARIALTAYGAVVIIHGLFYLAAGTYHGYGDGWALNRALGAQRSYFALPIAAAVVAITYLASLLFVSLLRTRLPRDSSRAQLAAIVIAGLAAGAGHGALAFGELALRPDRTYAQIMTHQYERDVERGLIEYLRAQQQRGVAPSEAEIADQRRMLVREYQPFPLNHVLGVLLGVAFLAAAIRSRQREQKDDGPLSLRDLRWVGAACLASIAIVAVLKWAPT